ncbi:MAG: hypothetical protein KC502_14110 [Myxococcales bacterium]|nr:hypothetical protein [Myxococcales bacterium]
MNVDTRDQKKDAQGEPIPDSFEDNTMGLPIAELGMRYGLTDTVDVGAKLVLPMSAMVDAKLQFLDSPTYAAAVGLSLGYMGVQINDSEFTIIDVSIPLFLSYDINDYLAIYLVPKYFLRQLAAEDSKTDWLHMAGSSVGVRLGRDFGLFIEATRMEILNRELTETGQVGYMQTQVSLFFNFGGGAPRAMAPPAVGAPSPAARR